MAIQINYNEFYELYQRGLSDTKIANVLHVSRKTIERYRKTQELPSIKDTAKIRNQNILIRAKALFEQGKSNGEVAKELQLSVAHTREIRIKIGYKAFNCKKLTEEKEKELVSMYNAGMTDVDIANTLSISSALVGTYRHKKGLKTKFNYDDLAKIHKADFEPLFFSGKSDQEIADILGVSVDGVYGFRQRNSYLRESYKINKSIPLTQLNKEVLLGTLLGDSSLTLGNGAVNPRLTCSHCIQQKEYLEYKSSLLENLGSKVSTAIRKQYDTRTNKIYTGYTMSLPANPELLPLYKAFYVDHKKVIPMELMSDFSALSLAILFMDDGSKTKNSYQIATNCFSEKEITLFRVFLLQKFNIETTMQKSHVIYIRAKSRDTFTSLVKPYICDCMKYKLIL